MNKGNRKHIKILCFNTNWNRRYIENLILLFANKLINKKWSERKCFQRRIWGKLQTNPEFSSPFESLSDFWTNKLLIFDWNYFEMSVCLWVIIPDFLRKSLESRKTYEKKILKKKISKVIRSFQYHYVLNESFSFHEELDKTSSKIMKLILSIQAQFYSWSKNLSMWRKLLRTTRRLGRKKTHQMLKKGLNI